MIEIYFAVVVVLVAIMLSITFYRLKDCTKTLKTYVGASVFSGFVLGVGFLAFIFKQSTPFM